MLPGDRAAERREDMVGVLRSKGYTRVVDLSGEEARGRYFEGTGVLVLDRINGVAYVSLSERADKVRFSAGRCAPSPPPPPPRVPPPHTPALDAAHLGRAAQFFHMHVCALPKRSGQLASIFVSLSSVKWHGMGCTVCSAGCCHDRCKGCKSVQPRLQVLP